MRSIKCKEDQKETKCQQLLTRGFLLENQNLKWVYTQLWYWLISHLKNYQMQNLEMCANLSRKKRF